MKPRTAIAAIVLLPLVLSLSCITTYLGDPEKSQVDEKYVGIWHQFDEHQEQIWLVHRYDARTYLTQQFTFRKSDEGVMTLRQPAGASFKTWLTPIDGNTFASMEAFMPKRLTAPNAPEAKMYIVVRATLDGDRLKIEPLNSERVQEAKIDTPQKLEEWIKANAEGTYMEPEEFTRVDPRKPGAAQVLLEQIEGEK